MIPELETPCEACYGKGFVIVESLGCMQCETCEGAGFAPTELGARLIAFARHQGIMPDKKPGVVRVWK